MKNFLILLVLCTLYMLVRTAPYLNIDNDDVYDAFLLQKDGLDALVALLPLYGWVKLSTLLKPRTLDQLVVIIYLNIKLYFSHRPACYADSKLL